MGWPIQETRLAVRQLYPEVCVRVGAPHVEVHPRCLAGRRRDRERVYQCDADLGRVGVLQERVAPDRLRATARGVDRHRGVA